MALVKHEELITYCCLANLRKNAKNFRFFIRQIFVETKNFRFLCTIWFSFFRYFFHLLAALIGIGTLNGLVFLPVLLSLVGPGPEVSLLTCFVRIGSEIIPSEC